VRQSELIGIVAVVGAYPIVVATALAFTINQISIKIIQVDGVTQLVSGEHNAFPMTMIMLHVDCDWRLGSPGNERVVRREEVFFGEFDVDV